MIHATDMATDTTPENLIQEKRVERFNLSHLAVTIEETTIKPQTSRAAIRTADHNHHTKPDNMTSIPILDDAATTVQTGPKSKHTRIAKELIMPPKNVKLVLIVSELYISVISAAPQSQVM